MSAKQITVVVLTYNHAGFIEKALNSILVQKTTDDFVVAIADDASTDGTQAILRRFKLQYPEKIELYLNSHNLGVEINMHRALRRVKTEYFAFLEGDDCWCDENKLQLQLEALDKNPDCAICGHNTIMRDLASGSETWFIPKDAPVKQKYSSDAIFRVHPSSRMYRNCVDFARTPPFMIYDTAMFLLFISRGNLLYLDRPMSIYNITGQGMWSGRDTVGKKLLALTVAYKSGRYLKFRYDAYQSPKSKWLKMLKACLGKKMGWFLFYHASRIILRTRQRFRKSRR